MQNPLHQHLTESEGQVIIIPSQGDTIGGIAYHYKEFYPPELEPYIEFDDYQKVMTDINETVKSYWPCFFTICMGYVLCPVTLGLSLLLPRICIKDAEEEVQRIIEGANADYFHPKGAQMEFRKETFKSWDDAKSSDAITKPVSLTTDQKIRCAQNIFKARGYKGLFDKWEFYVIPFTTSRITEGIIYFAVMRFLMDVIGFSDVFYIITAIAIFLCDIIGAFAFKLTVDLMTTPESRDLKVYLDPKNRHFWKQYEIDHAFYQVYGYFQSYAQLITYWYFQPSIILEIVLYAVSRIVGVVSSAPVGAISRYAKEFNYDYMKTLDVLMKKFGPLGLFAGAKDSCIIEVILSVIQVPIDIITKAIF